MTDKRIVWALFGLLLIGVGVVIGWTIARPMTSFGRAFTMANLAGVLVVLALVAWMIRGKD